MQQPLIPADCFDDCSTHPCTEQPQRTCSNLATYLILATEGPNTQPQFGTGRSKKILCIANALAPWDCKELVTWDLQVFPSSSPCCTLQHRLQLPHGLCQTWQIEHGRKTGFPSWPLDLVQQLNAPVHPSLPPTQTHYWKSLEVHKKIITSTLTITNTEDGDPRCGWVQALGPIPWHLFSFTALLYDEHIDTSVLRWGFHCFLPLISPQSFTFSQYCQWLSCFAVSTTHTYFIKCLCILRPSFSYLYLLIFIPLHYYCLLTTELLVWSILNSSMWKIAMDKANCIALKVSFNSLILSQINFLQNKIWKASTINKVPVKSHLILLKIPYSNVKNKESFRKNSLNKGKTSTSLLYLWSSNLLCRFKSLPTSSFLFQPENQQHWGPSDDEWLTRKCWVTIALNTLSHLDEASNSIALLSHLSLL